MKLNELTEQIIGAAVTVHRALGPGLLESTYEACLCRELAERGPYTQRQKAPPITYKGLRLGAGYRIDVLVERSVIVELKAVARLEPIYEAQLHSYLRLSGCHVGLLINFNVNRLTKGVRRIVHDLPQAPSAHSAPSAVKSLDALLADRE